jgi:hypothetical protein
VLSILKWDKSAQWPHCTLNEVEPVKNDKRIEEGVGCYGVKNSAWLLATGIYKTGSTRRELIEKVP